MPPFVLGVEDVVAFGDFGTRAGPLPVAADLAWSIRDGLAGRRLRPLAVVLAHRRPRRGADLRHARPGPGDPARAARGQHRRAAAAHPGPLRRLGAAVGAAIRAAPGGGRVLVAASGGLSHWLPSNDPRDPSIPGERRASVIHGRRDVHAVAAAREPRVRAMGGDPNARVAAGLGPVVPRPARRLRPGRGGRAGRRAPAGRGGQRRPRGAHLARRARGGRRAAALVGVRAGARVDHRDGRRRRPSCPDGLVWEAAGAIAHRSRRRRGSGRGRVSGGAGARARRQRPPSAPPKRAGRGARPRSGR